MVNIFGRTFFERLKALTADVSRGPFAREPLVFKPRKISTYYDYYLDYDLISMPIDDITEGAVGQGHYTTVENLRPIRGGSRSKDLVDEFNKQFNLDSLLPNITRNMLIAGFCPVESQIKRGPVDKNALKIIHPKTVSEIKVTNDTEIDYIIQKVGDAKPVKIAGKDLAWFVYRQIANDVMGVSFIRPLYDLLNTLIKATKNVDAILDRYIAPLGIWKSRRSIDAIRQAALNRNQGEDIFLGKLQESEMKDGVVEFISIDPRVPYWEYIEYLDRRVYSASRANNLWYTRNATQASADVMQDIVNRLVNSVQRNVKRSVEKYWYTRLIEVNGLTEVPKLNFGVEKTGVEDIRIEDFLTKGLEIGYVSNAQFNDFLRQLGLKLNPEEEPEDEEPEEEEEPTVEPELELK